MKNRNRIKLPLADKVLKTIALILTLVWIGLLLFPIYWMVVSSFKDAAQQYADPPEFGFAFPNAYTFELDYTAEQYAELGEEGAYDEANLILWRVWNGYPEANVGRAEVVVTVDGQPTVEYELGKADFQIRRQELFDKAVLRPADIRQALSYIKTNELVDVVKTDVSLPETAGSNDSCDLMMENFVGEEGGVTGTIKAVTVRSAPENLFDNYRIAWSYPNRLGIAGGLAGPVFNTVYIAVMTFLLQITVCSIAAYSLSKLMPRFVRGKILMVLLTSGMVPGTVTLISKYQVMDALYLTNNPWGIILPAAAGFGAILLFKGTFDAFPDSILEAARIDGANELYCYFRFALPSAIGVVGVQALSIFNSVWNDFFWPMMLLRDPEKYTIGLVMNILLNGSGNAPDYAVSLALGFLISIPTLTVYALFQKTLNYGFDYSGLKG